MREPEFVAKTLNWCNDRRKEKGWTPLEHLPKGIRGNSSSCPCGKASGVKVALWDWSSDGWKTVHKLPACVRQFVAAFDSKNLPQYDAEVGP